MSTENNKALSRRHLEELWNRKNVSIIGELLAATYVDHTPPASADDREPQGPEALKRLFEALHRNFSDIHASIEDQIAEEDKVMTRVIWECTLKSDDPFTASQVTVMGVGIDRIDRGKIVESWNALDVPYRLLILNPGTFKLSHVHCDRHHPCPPPYICNNEGNCQRA